MNQHQQRVVEYNRVLRGSTVYGVRGSGPPFTSVRQVVQGFVLAADPVRLEENRNWLLSIFCQGKFAIYPANAELLLEDERGPANPLPFQADIYLDTVGDLD